MQNILCIKLTTKNTWQNLLFLLFLFFYHVPKIHIPHIFPVGVDDAPIELWAVANHKNYGYSDRCLDQRPHSIC